MRKGASFEDQMLAGRVYAGTAAFRRKLDFAMTGIRAMLDVAPNSYVSVSFGKQSICMAHMVQQVRPDIPMFFLAHSETWVLHDFDRVITSYVERFRPNLTIVQLDRWQEAETWAEAVARGKGDMQRMCDRGEWDGWFIGLSADESRARRITLAQGAGQHNAHPTIFRHADGKYRCCPLKNWGWREIAAYVSLHDLPLLSFYQRYGLEQRTTARISRRVRENAGLDLLRQGNASLAALLNRFPDIKAM